MGPPRQLPQDPDRQAPNVEFIPGTTLDANGVKEYGAEIVVIATGAYWATDGLNGCTHDTIPGADASSPWWLTPEQIMRDGKEVRRREGRDLSTTTATSWACRSPRSSPSEGKKVTLMTPLGHIAPYMHFTLEAPNQHRKLHKLGVDIVTYHIPSRIEQGSVAATHVFDEDAHEQTWDADAVVLVTQRRSDEALYRELKDRIGFDALGRGRDHAAATGSATARLRA